MSGRSTPENIAAAHRAGTRARLTGEASVRSGRMHGSPPGRPKSLETSSCATGTTGRPAGSGLLLSGSCAGSRSETLGSLSVRECHPVAGSSEAKVSIGWRSQPLIVTGPGPLATIR